VIRTTNLLERLFLEERRRTKIIPHAFGERPVLKLMYAAVIRAADRWRGLAVGEFEQRQLRAIREELDRAMPSARGPPCATSRARRRRSYPARIGLDRPARLRPLSAEPLCVLSTIRRLIHDEGLL
jgi:hypothetical protein